MRRDYQVLTGESADMSTVATSDGVFMYVSSASRRLLGWDPPELEGRREDEFIHPDDIPSFHAVRASASARDGGAVMTYRYRRADGSYRWVEATSRALEADGSTFVVATVRDDFGTGYSSLAYLRQFPLDFVKIDRLFVQGLAVAAGEDAIVAAIISLAHAIGLYVVAEGVETAGQLDALNLLGCDCAQGFLLGRPGAPGAVDTLISTEPPPTRDPS
jgi:PAS domain S-box-containing protein